MSSSRERLEAWVAANLANPAPVGGRNNQLIQVMPRMLELGWDDEGIIEAWLDAYEQADGRPRDDKMRELELALENARKYVTSISSSGSSSMQARRIKIDQARLDGERWLPSILQDPWTLAEIKEAGQIGSWDARSQQLAHLSMFQPDDTIWLGAVHQSGLDKRGQPRAAHLFKPRCAWDQMVMTMPIRHEFISHCTFNAGSISRCNQSVVARRYLVIESDELDINAIGSVFAWINREMTTLRAVVFSGKRSLHGWFDMPAAVDLVELGAFIKGLKCDPATIRPSQPVRFAGAMRKDTNKLQSLLYIDLPTNSANEHPATANTGD